MWAAPRIVSRLCVVRGAPKRTRRTASVGVAMANVRANERKAGYILMLVLKTQGLLNGKTALYQ